MIKEEKLKRNVSHKSFLLIIKFLPHLIALLYAVYIFCGFYGIDLFVISYFIHVSILPWIGLYLLSFVFKYCYVHRLPLYYIALNEILTVTDYYVNIPISTSRLLQLYLVITILLIFGYSVYYYKNTINKLI